MSSFRLIKDSSIVKYYGVCAGLAYALGIPTWIVRTLFILSTFFVFPLNIIVYWVLAWAVPVWTVTPADYHELCE